MAKFAVGISRNVWQVITIEADNKLDAWDKAQELADIHDWSEYDDGETRVDFVSALDEEAKYE